MKELFKPNPVYAELSAYEKCLIDEFTERRLDQQHVKTGRPRIDEFQQAHLHLRDVLLALGGIGRIHTELSSPEHPDRAVAPYCRQLIASRHGR